MGIQREVCSFMLATWKHGTALDKIPSGAGLCGLGGKSASKGKGACCAKPGFNQKDFGGIKSSRSQRLEIIADRIHAEYSYYQSCAVDPIWAIFKERGKKLGETLFRDVLGQK